ncbi:MAG: hypothetical protein LBV15_01175 [Planctomycetota bacterium]|nr:hypothetical protein [Planctomycetota bacterium]
MRQTRAKTASRPDSRPPRRRGCRRFFCLGCLAIPLFLVLGLCLAIYFLIDPGRDASGWDRLPASTVLAVEARDLAGLIRRINAEPALRDLIQSLSREHVAPFLPPELSGQLSPGFNLIDLAEILARSRVFLPNVILAGAVPGREGQFMLFRPPPLWRWLGGIRDETARPGDAEFTALTLDTEGGKIHLVSRDGWLMLAPSPETLREFVFPDRTAPPPLGPAPAGDAPGLRLAIREKREAGGGLAPDGQPEEDPFPFAWEDPPDATAPAADILHRLALTQAGTGWEVSGAFSLAPGAPLPEKPAWPAVPAPPPGNDVFAQARISPERLAEWLDKLRLFLAGNWPARLAEAGIRPEPWLLDAWLSRVSGDFQFLAAKPAEPDMDLVPPLPVVSLAWSWKPELEPEAAGRDFAQAGREFLAALTGPEAPQPLPLLKESLALEERFGPGIRMGCLNLPPVMANASRPAWALPLGPEADSPAWLASDPAGLPGAEGGAPPFSTWILPEPKPGGARLTAAWNLSPPFRKALLAVIRDRLETLSDSDPPGRKTILENFGRAEPILALFSAGELRLIDDGGGISLLMRLERGK